MYTPRQEFLEKTSEKYELVEAQGIVVHCFYVDNNRQIFGTSIPGVPSPPFAVLKKAFEAAQKGIVAAREDMLFTSDNMVQYVLRRMEVQHG